MIKTFIVVGTPSILGDVRGSFETIENTILDIPTDSTSLDVRKHLIERLNIGFDPTSGTFEVYPITDFMDEFNDDELKMEHTFMTYFYI